jgi:hypothetical protein
MEELDEGTGGDPFVPVSVRFISRIVFLQLK